MFQKHHSFIQDQADQMNLRSLPRNKRRDLIDFSSNDYLCLSKDEDVLESGYHAAKKYGSGATGSRLLSGNHDIYMQLEAQIAKDLRCEDALLFNSGFQLNSTVIPALFEGWLIFSDKNNHASIHYGLTHASSTQFVRYKHNNITDLEYLIKKHASDSRPKAIISETLFGMDGDIAQLAALRNICLLHNIFLFLDDSHAIGLYGPHGYGLSTSIDLRDIQFAVMGTFSKGVGSSGAFIALSSLLKTYLLQKCAGFIYSTALSPFCIGASAEAWRKIRIMGAARERISVHAKNVAQHARQFAHPLASNSHIVMLEYADNEELLAKQRFFESRSIYLAAVRRPTSITPRLRIAINSSIKDEHVSTLANAMRDAHSEPI